MVPNVLPNEKSDLKLDLEALPRAADFANNIEKYLECHTDPLQARQMRMIIHDDTHPKPPFKT